MKMKSKLNHNWAINEIVKNKKEKNILFTEIFFWKMTTDKPQYDT